MVATFLDRLGRTAARRHRVFLVAWVLTAIAIAALAVANGGRTFDNFTIPGSESQRVIDLLESRFSEQAGAGATVVIRAPSGTLTNPASEAAVEQSVANIKALPEAPTVVGPVPAPDDPDITLVDVQYRQPVGTLGIDGFDALEQATAPARAAGLEVAFGGQLTDYASAPRSSASDLVGLLVALVILVFAFGSIVAAGLPIGTALLGLAVGLASIFLLASFTDVGSAAPALGSMIGLGVGIDYSLFIVTRHRENLATGMEIEESIGRSLATAGQAVLFAGTTVVIAICGLLVAGIPYVAVLGFTAAIVVAVMMLAALTLLPALLGLVGARIDKGRVPRLRRRSRGADHDDAIPTGTGPSPFWERWATRVARHPWPFGVASVLVLLTLALPFLSIRYGEADDGTAPAGSTQRIAYDLTAQGYGKGANGPLAIVVTFPTGQDVPPTLTQALGATPGVATVAPAQVNPAGDTAIVTVIPASAPDAQATTDLVDQLRTETIPTALSGTDARAYVGGVTAAFIDLGARIEERLPLFIGLVIFLSFLLLMLVFHSIAIPATAALMNLLSVGAAYGVTVAVFQWGWGTGVLGLSSTVPIISFVPMMMFAILFGLSMDYQVFLLTRVREEYNRSGETRSAVVMGVSRTARVITSAALIMISVFLSFVASPIPEIKMFGLGLAVAVAVDSTVVRMALVPATMEILGKANWWFPAWLERRLPRISIE